MSYFRKYFYSYSLLFLINRRSKIGHDIMQQCYKVNNHITISYTIMVDCVNITLIIISNVFFMIPPPPNWKLINYIIMRSPDTTFVIELLSPSTVPSGVQRVLLFIYCIVLYCIMRPYTDGPIGPLSYRHSSGVVRNPHSTLAK